VETVRVMVPSYLRYTEEEEEEERKKEKNKPGKGGGGGGLNHFITYIRLFLLIRMGQKPVRGGDNIWREGDACHSCWPCHGSTHQRARSNMLYHSQ
jgi:hypothetical protein